MPAWDITSKDLSMLLRDRRTFATLLVLPMIFITIIGVTTGRLLGWNEGNKMLTIIMVDQVDYGAIKEGDLGRSRTEERRHARNIVVKVFNNLQQLQGIEMQEVEDVETARAMYQEGDANGALIIGPDFYERLNELAIQDMLDPYGTKLQGDLKSLDITLEGENEEGTTQDLVESIIFSVTHGTTARYVVCSSSNRSEDPQRLRTECEEIDNEAKRGAIDPLPPQAEPQSSSRVYQEIIPGYTVLFVFFLVNIMSRSFIDERQLGTLRRLRIAPVRPVSLLAGKTVPFLIVSLVQSVLLFLCGKLLFGMSWGEDPWLLLPVIFCTSLAATALGLMIATLVRSEAQVSAYATAVVIVLGGISGCFLPRDWLPAAMQKVSLGTPHAWSLIAYSQLLTNQHAEYSLWLCCLALCGFAALFFTIGSLRFARVE
ncbi:MAG: ABC transporter permease [Planctomycetaceae bacterium]